MPTTNSTAFSVRESEPVHTRQSRRTSGARSLADANEDTSDLPMAPPHTVRMRTVDLEAR